MKNLLYIALLFFCSCKSLEQKTVSCLQETNQEACLTKYLTVNQVLFKKKPPRSIVRNKRQYSNYYTIKQILTKPTIYVARINGSHHPYYGLVVTNKRIVVIDPVSSKTELEKQLETRLNNEVDYDQVIIDEIYSYLYRPKTF